MPDLTRFGVSIPSDLIKKFDAFIKKRDYSNRSEAIRDLIREKMVAQEWSEGKTTAGAIILVYDHHKRDLMTRLTGIQHDFHDIIISSQHVHLDHHNCLEIIVVRGKTEKIMALAHKMQAIKGVKHATLSSATTGKDLI